VVENKRVYMHGIIATLLSLNKKFDEKIIARASFLPAKVYEFTEKHICIKKQTIVAYKKTLVYNICS